MPEKQTTLSTHPVLFAHRITKRFPGVMALKEVSFDLRSGEVHAVCGENGAGKSTLIKLLSGIYPHGSYEGELRIDDRPAQFESIADAARAGLAVIYQELALVDEMTVAENIFLGAEPRRFGLVDWKRMHCEARALLGKFQVAIDPSAQCARLGIGQKQLVEIVKALGKKSRILILDEPTAALAAHEVQLLLEIVRDLRRRGIACIYISHKLDEVFAVADRITVLRDGASVLTVDAASATRSMIIRSMVGRDIHDLFPRRVNSQSTSPENFAASPDNGDVRQIDGQHQSSQAQMGGGTAAQAPAPDTALLRVEDLSVSDLHTGKIVLRDISFALAPSEVLGIGGLMGAGRTELLMHLFGVYGKRRDGRVILNGKELPSISPADILRRGMALVSEDRRRYGLILEQSVGFNLSLASLRRLMHNGLIDADREFQENRRVYASLGIKAPGLESVVAKLSGGNQQKTVLGKMLMTGPNVILLDEPTRGIDVGAKLEIYEIINALTASGKAVVLVSSELPELIGMSDRILMLHEGRIGGTFSRVEATQERLMHAAMGQAMLIADC
jgi:D-xylose transport system ATP-binding protein